MSNAFLPRGTQFKRSPDGASYTTVAEAKRVAVSIKGAFEDVSNFDSPTAYKEYIPGLIDGGSIKVDCNLINTDAIQTDFYSDLANQTLLYWRIQLPSTRGKLEFQGFVEEVAPDLSHDKAAAMSVSVKVTGQVTWTANV